MWKKKVLIKRMRIGGPMEEYDKALIWCWEHGYVTTMAGAKAVRYRYDTSRFLIVAEKEVSDGTGE